MRILRLGSAVLILFQLAASFPALAGAAEVGTTDESGVYQENFSSYDNLDYVLDLDWDIWDGLLRIPLMDGVNQEQPQVASDNNGNTYVVWQDRRSGDYDIYAQKLDGNGSPLWETDVRVNSGSGDQVDPANAVDQNGNLVVVWQYSSVTTIYAQKLDKNGNRLWVDDVYVAGDEDTFWYDHPDVVVDSHNDIVIVYAGWGNWGGNIGIWGQKLDESGNHLWPDFFCLGGTDYGNTVPTVAVDSEDNIIAAWEDSRNEYDYGLDIYAIKLNSDQWLWDAEVRVNSDVLDTRQMDPKISVDSAGNIYIVWVDERNRDADIYGQKLSANGDKLWPADIRINSDSGSTEQGLPDITSDGIGNQVIVWEDYRNTNSDIYTQKIDSSGLIIGANDVRVHTYSGTADQRVPAVALDSDGYLIVAWEDYRHGNSDIYAQRLSVNGSRFWEYDGRVPVSASGASNQFFPDVEVDSTDNFFVVWSDTRNGYYDIYAKKLDPNGNEIWPNDVRINSSNITDPQSHPRAAVDSNDNLLVVWQNTMDGNSDLYVQKIDQNGNKLWANDQKVNLDDVLVNQRNPALETDSSGNIIVSWEDDRNGNWDIYAQKLGPGGNRSWVSDARVDSDNTGSDQLQPVIKVLNNDDFVVVWTSESSSSSAIYAQKLAPDGAKLWANEVHVAVNQESYKYDPKVAVGNSDSLYIIWSSDEIYGQKLDANGSRLWLTDVRFTSTFSWPGKADLVTDSSENVFIVWVNWLEGIHLQKFNSAGSPIWSSVKNIFIGRYTGRRFANIFPSIDLESNGNSLVVWDTDYFGNTDSFAQKIDSTGNKIWPADEPIVFPDIFYLSSGAAQSRTVDTVAGHIRQATLTANYQTNGGEVRFFLSHNGGNSWSQVVPGATNVFSTPGSDLRWRVELTADPLRLFTPVLSSVRIDYSTQGFQGYRLNLPIVFR